MPASVIITVLNEAQSLPPLLDSLVAQTRPPDEVIVCDGGSTDATLDVLDAETRLPLRVVRRPGANIAQGRNAAIEIAGCELIAVTDAGVRLTPRWLERLLAPFEDPQVHAAAGSFVAHAESPFEVAMAATVLPAPEELADLDRYPPSSRSFAFRKAAWQTVGGYPGWLDYCEDVVFDRKLQRRYGHFPFVAQAIVHFRPRPSLRAFWLQYYRYARGDGKANLCLHQHLLRYVAYLSGPLLALLGLLSGLQNLALLPLLVPLAVVAVRSWRPYHRAIHLWSHLRPLQKLKAALSIPLIRLTGDLAKMAGYPAGVCWRLKHRSRLPNWRRQRGIQW